MAQGVVTVAGVPVIPLEVAGQIVIAVIDTGYEGGLQLPDSYELLVNATPLREQLYQYPNGTMGKEQLYTVEIMFDGEPVTVETKFAPTDEVLLGVDALRDYRLEVNFVRRTVLLERVRN